MVLALIWYQYKSCTDIDQSAIAVRNLGTIFAHFFQKTAMVLNRVRFFDKILHCKIILLTLFVVFWYRVYF